jgi:hypothetical protein
MTADTKNCPYCGEVIMAVAKKCRHCKEYLDPSARPREEFGAVDRMILPVGRPASAIASGYLALFSIIPVFGLPMAIMAVVFGWMALSKIKKDPALHGKGRAWFGIIVGSIMTVLSVIGVIAIIIDLS